MVSKSVTKEKSEREFYLPDKLSFQNVNNKK